MTSLLKEIELSNIRSFEHLKLRFGDKEPRMKTCIIGKNGTNKTTILRSIALAYSGFKAPELLGSTHGNMLRQGNEKGTIKSLDWDEKPGNEVHFIGGSFPAQTSESSDRMKKFACGFGAGRGDTETFNDSREPYMAVLSLFRFGLSQISPELALRRLEDSYSEKNLYEVILQKILLASNFTDKDELRIDKTLGIFVKGPTVGGLSVPLAALADGYRRPMVMFIDLFHRAMIHEAVNEDGDIEGILLIDEIEQHLHPSMQAQILGRLGEQFPKMQIIVTTHSPLVALGCSPDELVVLKREGDRVVLVNDVPNTEGFSVHDILMSADLFDTSPYAPEYAKDIETYERLAVIPAEKRTSAEVNELQGLTRKLQGHQIISAPEDDSETAVLLKTILEKLG